jgi:hypothetical protein
MTAWCERAVEFRVVNGVADCFQPTVPQPTEWQCIENQIKVAMIFAWPDFVNVH